MDFRLDSRLAGDCIDLGALELCRVLLMDDARFPWVILVPQRPDLTEIYQLSTPERIRLITESTCVSQRLARDFDADKMNIAAIGNLVPQLHVHHIVRYRSDAAWPGPVWGFETRRPYAPRARDRMSARLRRLVL